MNIKTAQAISQIYLLLTNMASMYYVIFHFALFSPPVAGGVLQPPPPPPELMLNSLAALIILSFIGLVIIICFIIAIYARCCTTEQRMSIEFTEGDSRRRRRRLRRSTAYGLDPHFIDTFPTFLYSDVKGLKVGGKAAPLECVVCLNEFEDDDSLRLLPTCSHVFHPVCIDGWLASHVTCPVCRTNLLPVGPGRRRITLLSHNPAIDSPVYEQVHYSGNGEINGACPAATGRSTPKRHRIITGKFSRSHTTGHYCDSLLRPGENVERFTLRVPEEVRNRLVNAGLSRNRSCAELPAGERSWRKGYRSNSGGAGLGRSVNGKLGYTPLKDERGGGGEELMAVPTSLIRSVKAPLDRFFSGAENDSAEEQSLNKLLPS
ncbi:unnamed protein product [Cuscuta europaea]|uniref:RING-type E3 ubiquitin transferase n=1 Tax=Cuscuta europaea TaxID=41803 RepID=A0A9P0VNI4_CUSEU|nr:unnamed protein product [Cuscuta europaea]